MKKIFFIIASVLCFTVITSCNPDKDDPITEEQKPTTNPNSYKNVTKLKNFTGKDILTITPEIEAEGLVYQGEAPFDEEISVHLFMKSDMSILYMLYEAKDVIFMSVVSHAIFERDTAFNYFENYSLEPVAMLSNKVHDYYGACILNDQTESEFLTYQSFLTYYNDNKNNMLACLGSWDTELEQIATILEYENSIYMPMLMYMNKPITPPSMLEKNISKIISENIVKKLRR